jgi:glycine cleavage system H protein
MYPADRKYTTDHEWIRITGAEGQVGITDFAQRQLGDVVFVDLPAVGRSIKKGEVFGTIESVKAVSELFAPASGQVTQVNTALSDHPQTVNEKPHETWMILVRLADPGELDGLLDADQYAALAKE